MIQLTSVTLFFLQCLAGVAWAQTVATDAPGIYQGLYRKPEGGVETLNCGPNSIFATSSTFAGCCSIGGNCNFPTACATGTATNRLGETFTCGQDQQCYTMTVVGNYASPTQSVVVHNCAKEWLATTIYREIPGAAITRTQSSVTSAASPGAPVTSVSSPSPSATPPPAASSISDAIESSTDSSEPEPAKPSKTNGGIIAGITIGAVCGLVAAGLLGFWFGRRNGLRARPSPSSEEGSSNPFQLLGPSKGLSSASHIRSATGLTGVSAIGSIPGVPNDPWYGYTFPAPPKSPASGGYPETPYDKSIGHQHQVQINEMEGDSVSIRTAGEKSLTKSAGGGGGHFYEHGFGIGPGPTVPSGVYRDSSKARKSWRAGHAELEGEGLGIVPVRENSMI